MDIKDFKLKNNTVDSLDTLFKIIIKNYHQTIKFAPYNNIIINAIRNEIDDNFILLKNIKLIKINFNKIINFYNYQFNLNNMFKEEIYQKIINDNIYSCNNSDDDLNEGIMNIPYNIVKLADKHNNIYTPCESEISVYLINNVLFINVITDKDKDYLSTKTTYKIDLNNNKLLIYQKINKQYINFLNHKSSLEHFKFVLHKNNILIGYKAL